MLLNREPVLWYSVISALVYGVTEFGLQLTSGQQAAILTLTLAVLGFLTRQVVTPVAEPRIPARNADKVQIIP